MQWIVPCRLINLGNVHALHKCLIKPLRHLVLLLHVNKLEYLPDFAFSFTIT